MTTGSAWHGLMLRCTFAGCTYTFQLFIFISLEGQYKLHLCRHLTSVYIELRQYCLLLNVRRIDECHKG